MGRTTGIDERYKVDDSQCVLVRLMNKFDPKTGKPVYRIGYRCWLADERHDSEQKWEAALKKIELSEHEVTIMWPQDLNVKSAKETLRDLPNKKFETTVVQIVSHGDRGQMLKQLSYMITIGKITANKEDRRESAKKKVAQDENFIYEDPAKNKKKKSKKKEPKKAGKQKIIIKKTEEEKQAALEKLERAKNERKALAMVDGNITKTEVSPMALHEKNAAETSMICNSSDTADATPVLQPTSEVSPSGSLPISTSSDEATAALQSQCKDSAAVPSVTNSVDLGRADAGEDGCIFTQGASSTESAVQLEIMDQLWMKNSCTGPVPPTNTVTVAETETIHSTSVSNLASQNEMSSHIAEKILAPLSDLSDGDREGSLVAEKSSATGILKKRKKKFNVLSSDTEDCDNETEKESSLSLPTEGSETNSPAKADQNRARTGIQQVKMSRGKNTPSGGARTTPTLPRPENFDQLQRRISNSIPSMPPSANVAAGGQINSQENQFDAHNEIQTDAGAGATDIDNFLTMGVEELRKELANKVEEMRKRDEELQRKDEKLREKSKEAEQWKSQCNQLKRHIKRCEERVMKCFRTSFDSTDNEDESPQAQTSSSSSTPSSPSVGKDGGEKRKRKRSEEGTKPIAKRRKKFPITNTYVLDRKIKAICDDTGRTVRKVVEESLPLLFTAEELSESCLLGSRAKNPGSVPASQKQRGPPLDKEKLNALMNRCHKRFHRDPDWYEKFKSAAKYTMGQYRSKNDTTSPEQDSEATDERD